MKTATTMKTATKKLTHPMLKKGDWYEILEPGPFTRLVHRGVVSDSNPTYILFKKNYRIQHELWGKEIRYYLGDGVCPHVVSTPEDSRLITNVTELMQKGEHWS